MQSLAAPDHADAIAVIGMAGRFPGANTLDAFWRNLQDGVESIVCVSAQELEQAGVDPGLVRHRHYVKAGAVLDHADQLDAAFFGLNPREAEVIDPQHRLLLECAWEALENAGYSSETDSSVIGVYAGAGTNTYLFNLVANPALVHSVGRLQIGIGNDKDYLATRLSYKLGLKGPSLTVQTACSTSLVAVHLACQSLLNHECDIALAGGVRLRVPHQAGYLYQEGGIWSPDGHCRTFDRRAQGTVTGNGVGVVVLKRLEDARVDGDSIDAVIRGSAINNDGAVKAGYTAPSAEGQAEVIAEALAVAGVEPETITYVEAHGTGTALGDPIEIAALTRAFRARTTAKRFCAIGSVKTNIGHLDAAAGITGIIKTVLALQHRQLPPSLHFEQPNPNIDFADGPFYVNTALNEWHPIQHLRRAGVSSFGFGGTNAHVVLEEAPQREPSGPSRPWQLLVLSAKTPSALETATANLTAHLKTHPELNLADVAYTLQTGRRAFSYRRMLTCRDLDDAVRTLEPPISMRVPTRWLDSVQESRQRSVVFMFPGQGTQYGQMARELYDEEPIFREQVDACAAILQPHLERDLRRVLYPDNAPSEAAVQQLLRQTQWAQPALFVIEYALAQLWITWGIQPEAMIGHSIGEYVAATLAGVFTLEDALALVAARGALMQALPRGTMLAVFLSETEVQPFLDLDADLSLAAVNGPSLCVVSGPPASVARCAAQLTSQGVTHRELETSHAFHSAMMAPMMAPFMAHVAQIGPQPPQIPFVSNVTGTWITAADAIEPSYWAKHLRHPVRFAAGLETLIAAPDQLLLEIGPGQTLHTLARQIAPPEQPILTSLGAPRGQASDTASMLQALGQLWLAGQPIDWPKWYGSERRHRLHLPTYPFERQRYWVDAAKPAPMVNAHANASKVATFRESPQGKRLDIADWFYVPSWRPVALPSQAVATAPQASDWLVFLDQGRVGLQLVSRLQAQGHHVTIVRLGTTFAHPSPQTYTLNPRRAEDYEALLDALGRQNQCLTNIVHLWPVIESQADSSRLPEIAETQDLGFHSLLYLAQALGKQPSIEPLRLDVVSNRMQATPGVSVLYPAPATILGPCKVIPQEYPHLSCRCIDLALANPDADAEPHLIAQLIDEFTTDASLQDTVVAYRGNERLVQTVKPTRFDEAMAKTARLREQGVYLITGGLGGIGLSLAGYLAKHVQAKLVLTGRSAFPSRDAWAHELASRGPHDPVSHTIRMIQEFETLGAEVMVSRADVTNLQQMQAVIAQAETRFGPLHGVIHAAGVPDGAVIPRRTREMSDAILAPKLQGTLILDQVLSDRKLDFIVLCSSLSALLAPFGQVAYCAANAFLDAFAHYKTARDGMFTLSLNWDAWQEVGMAVAASKQLAETVEPPAAPTRDVTHPLFDHCIDQGSDREIYVSQFTAKRHWVLHEHTSETAAIMPGTVYLELALAAFKPHAGNRVIEMRDVYFFSPFRVDQDETKELHTILTRGEDAFEFVIQSPSPSAAEDWQEHARGHIRCLDGQPAQHHDIGKMAQGFPPPEEMTFEDYAVQNRLIHLGPRWNNFRYVCYTADQGLAFLEMPKTVTPDELDAYTLHPALLDNATAFFTDRVKDNGHYLPFSYKRLRIYGPLSRRIVSYNRYLPAAQSNQETLRFDITIMDENGTALVEIEEFTRRKIDPSTLSPPPLTTCENVCVDIRTPGDLHTLMVKPAARRQPGPGEVEIKVQAAGLNFKEVLRALGVLPQPSEPQAAFGLECAGEIVALGDGVDGVEVGDAVIALAPGCFSQFVTVAARLTAPKPATLTFAEAATLPIAYLTAYYALVQLGRLSQGERVLIHAAAGGVGLAAVNIAQWVGAEIFATAGNPDKRAFLHDLGIEHVMDSRTLTFADEVMRKTNGNGVNVVLNSLAGAFIPRSLALLAPYGRFLEIGIRDISNNSQLGLRPFEKSLSFFAVMVGAQLPDFDTIWRDVAQHAQAGHFPSLPHRVFPMADAASAFDYMAQAKHIGKIVLSPQAPAARRLPPSEPDGQDEMSAAAWHDARFGTGILPVEGTEVFRRAIGGAVPQLLVSTQDLLQLLAQGDTPRTRRWQDALQDVPLSQGAHARPALRTSYVAPSTAVEQTLAGIFQELLGVDLVGVDDSFFELGGHSLLAIQVLSRVRAAFQVDLSLPSLFETPTVAKLAAAVTNHLEAAPEPPIPSIHRASAEASAQLLQQIDHLSDAEVEVLLRERFAEEDESPE